MKFSLNGPWQARCLKNGAEDFRFTGTVPGCVHTDLAGSHLPADVHWGRNADACLWVEDRDWEYSRTFTADCTDYTQLVFEGLDTYADIYLNGCFLGSADDMFVPWRFSVAGKLQSGENTLTVRFRSPVREVAGKPPRKAAFANYERLYTRRIQCTYGWDWVARFVTCGIWRDVYLHRSEPLSLKQVYITTESISCGSAAICVEAELENYRQGGIVRLEILDPQGRTVYQNRWYRKESLLRAYIDLPQAQLWYPAGYGQQPLYTLRLCGQEYRFGIRTVRILQLPDQPGTPYHDLCLKIKNSPSGEKYDRNEQFSGFCLLVNDLPILCKGANWVPCEPFPSAETDEKQTCLLQLAREAGVNMLRVWGGGIFEKQHFYNECDRLGILVTQDFLMACGDYPSDEDTIAKLRLETEAAALALRNHPCLVWWSGDNENAVLGFDEAEDYKGRTAIHEGIEPVLAKLDPRRRFLPSSPCGGTPYASKTVGTTHNTQYLGVEIFPYIFDSDMTDYKERLALLARFIAEEPTLGASCLPSLLKFMSREEVFSGEALWRYHTKDNPALKFTLFDMLQVYSQKVLGDFGGGEDRFFKLKYAQYEWVRVSLENVRRHQGFCNGMVYWMWNDCWAASAGWSFVDYYCLPKASYYSFKRCAKQLVISVDGEGVWLCNDGLADLPVTLTVRCIRNGQAQLLQTLTATAPKGCAVKALPLPPMEAGDLLVCDGGGDRAFYRVGNLPVVPAAVTVEAQTADSVTVSAQSYVHAVELEGAYVFEDNYFSLLPGERRTVRLRPHGDGDGLTVTAYTVQT